MSLAKITLAMAVLATPISAQDANVPTDWTARLDAPQAAAVGQEVAAGEWRYTRMPPGWHVTTTEAGVVLFPNEVTVSGRWGIEVELFLFPHPSEAGLGIVVEGVSERDQYRFLMRRDGQASLEARSGEMLVTPQPWTTDTMATPHDDVGVIKYTMRLVNESGHLAFSINGHEMFAHAVEGSGPVLVPGLRIGKGLNVHVSRFDLITPLAPARPR